MLLLFFPLWFSSRLFVVLDIISFVGAVSFNYTYTSGNTVFTTLPQNSLRFGIRLEEEE